MSFLKALREYSNRVIVASLIFLVCPLSLAQGVRFGDASIVTTSTAGSFNIQYVPSALISVYNAPCTSLPCSSLATTYTDSTIGTPCPTSSQLVLQGTTSCVSATDPQGNWGVWVASGQYCYVITIGASNFGPYCFSASLTPPNGSTAVLPVTKASVAHQFLNSFTSSTGVFTSAQPAFSDLTGNATAAQGGTGSTSVPSAGQLPVGNAGGTAYAPVTVSGDCTLTSTGAITCPKINGGTVPASALLLATNGSSQPVAGTAHGVGNAVFCSPSSGSGTVYACTTIPGFTPGDGDLLDFDADVTNTGSATLNVNATGAVTIQKWFGCSGVPPCNLASGDIKANQPTWVYFDAGLNIWSQMSPMSQFALSALSGGSAPSGTFDFSGVTLFKGRVGAGATTTVNGDFAYDSTANNWHFWDNGADSINAVVPVATSITNGDAATWVKSGSNVVLGDGGPLSQNTTATAHNFFTAYTSSTGAFTKAQPAPADLSGEVDGNCIIGSGGSWGAGSCAGTAGEQVRATPNITPVTVNANVSTNQTLQTACTTTPCYSAGTLNSLRKAIRVPFEGFITYVNNTETVALSVVLNGVTTAFAQYTAPAAATFAFRFELNCVVTATGATGTMECFMGGFGGSAVGGRSSVTLDLTGAISPQLLISFTTASATNSATNNFSYSEQLN